MASSRVVRRRLAPWSAMMMVAVLGLAACVDQRPTDPTAANIPPSFNRSGAAGQQRVSGLDAEFLRVAQRARGFGGMFYDGDGRLHVYVTRAAGVSAQAREAVLEHARASLQARGRAAPLTAEITVLQADRDYVELVELRDRMSPVLGQAGVVFTDIDEAHNRLRVGVLADVSRAQIQAELERLGVPLDAVSIEVTAPIVPLATLLDAHDPVAGGLQIWRFVPPSTAAVCTLGFNVRLLAAKEARYFFTNSHCTAEQGVVDGSLFRQGPLALSTRTVAVEFADPPFFTCQYMGYRCRLSDAALAQYFPEVEVKLGMIYQTTYVGTAAAGSLATLVPGKAFSITGERSFPLINEVLDKVGRTTGWTRGPVIGTCLDVGVAGSTPPIALLCQDLVAMLSGGGDSGSPIFQPTGSADGAILYGLLWGGGTGFSVFSALDNIRAEFVEFRVR